MDYRPLVSPIHGIFQTRILEWVPFYRASSPTRGWTQISCIAGRFFTIWATREALSHKLSLSHKSFNFVIPINSSFIKFSNYKDQLTIIFFFKIEGLLLYSVVLVSAIQQQESVYIYIYIYIPPLKPPSPSHPTPSRSSQSSRLGSLCYIKPQSWMTWPCSTFLCWTDTNFPRPYQA